MTISLSLSSLSEINLHLSMFKIVTFREKAAQKEKKI